MNLFFKKLAFGVALALVAFLLFWVGRAGLAGWRGMRRGHSN